MCGPRSRGSEEPACRYGRSGLLTAFSSKTPSFVVSCAVATDQIAGHITIAAAAARHSLRKAIHTPPVYGREHIPRRDATSTRGCDLWRQSERVRVGQSRNLRLTD